VARRALDRRILGRFEVRGVWSVGPEEAEAIAMAADAIVAQIAPHR
jgi:hypothetical protein